MLTGAQLRAARSAVGWTLAELEEASGVSRRTLIRIEAQEGPVSGNTSTVNRVLVALEAAGIEFIEADDGAPGNVIRSKGAQSKPSS